MNTKEHGARGVTVVDGFVPALLKYWKGHQSQPESVQRRTKVRERQEAEQERMKDKHQKLQKRGKGEKAWAGQMRLPVKEKPAKEPWGESGVARR